MEEKDVGERYDAIRTRVRGELERKKGIDSSIRDIIAEVVVRRCEEFSFSAQELNRDIDSLTAFLDTVEFKKMMKGYEKAAGLFSISQKKISLSQPYLGELRNELLDGTLEKSSNWKAYQVFTHELYHAMSKHLNGRDRMLHYSAYTGEEMKNLLETITEVSSMRACSSNSEQDFLAGIRRCRGYGDLTFTVGVMAAAFGMTEKEFLKAGMEGYSTLETEAIKNSGSPNALDNFIDIDVITEKMHSELYPWGNEQAPTEEQLAQNLYTDTKSLISKAQTTIRDRLMFSDKPVEELAAEMMYNHRKLENNLTWAIQGFAYRIGRENVVELHDYNKSEGLETRKLVRGLYKVVERKDSFSPEEYEQAIEDIRSGKILEDYDKYAQMYGLESVEELEEEPEKMPESYMKKVRKDDFDNGRVWDNDDILRKVRDSIINNKLIHRIEDSLIHYEVSLKNKFRSLLPAIKAKLALPSAEQDTLPLSTVSGGRDTEPMEVVNATPQKEEPVLELGALTEEEKRKAQQGYLDVLRAVHTKEGGIEERKSNKDDREI